MRSNPRSALDADISTGPVQCSARLECGRLVRGRVDTKGHDLSSEHAHDQFRDGRICLRRGAVQPGEVSRVVRSRCSAAGRRDTCRLGLGGAYALGDTLRRARWRSACRRWFGRCDSSILKVCKVSWPCAPLSITALLRTWLSLAPLSAYLLTKHSHPTPFGNLLRCCRITVRIDPISSSEFHGRLVR